MFHLEMSFPAPGGRGDLRPSMESGTWVLSFPKPCVLLPSVIVMRTKFDLGRGKADAPPPILPPLKWLIVHCPSEPMALPWGGNL